MNLGDYLIGLYEQRTDADFAHMERRLASATPEELQGQGAALAQMFLMLRAMERSEADATRLYRFADPISRTERFTGPYADSFAA